MCEDERVFGFLDEDCRCCGGCCDECTMTDDIEEAAKKRLKTSLQELNKFQVERQGPLQDQPVQASQRIDAQGLAETTRLDAEIQAEGYSRRQFETFMPQLQDWIDNQRAGRASSNHAPVDRQTTIRVPSCSPSTTSPTSACQKESPSDPQDSQAECKVISHCTWRSQSSEE